METTEDFTKEVADRVESSRLEREPELGED